MKTLGGTRQTINVSETGSRAVGRQFRHCCSRPTIAIADAESNWTITRGEKIWVVSGQNGNNVRRMLSDREVWCFDARYD